MRLFIVITFFKDITAEMQGNCSFWTLKDHVLQDQEEAGIKVILLNLVSCDSDKYVESKNIFYIFAFTVIFLTQSIFWNMLIFLMHFYSVFCFQFCS